MVTISKDFLESLPDDDLVEFINTMSTWHGMSPSEKDELLEEKNREMYAGREFGARFKCSFCRKDEPDEIEFGGMFMFKFVLYAAVTVALACP